MSDWLMAIALVSGFSSYAFYLGTRWGRYTDEKPRKREAAPLQPKSWERAQRQSHGAASDYVLPDS